MKTILLFLLAISINAQITNLESLLRYEDLSHSDLTTELNNKGWEFLGIEVHDILSEPDEIFLGKSVEEGWRNKSGQIFYRSYDIEFDDPIESFLQWTILETKLSKFGNLENDLKRFGFNKTQGYKDQYGEYEKIITDEEGDWRIIIMVENKWLDDRESISIIRGKYSQGY